MRRRPLAAALLAAQWATLMATPAFAFGLNNIYGSQTIGKPFYAEIPLQSAPGVTESCIALHPAEGSADFFINDLKTSVTGPANARRLVITSQMPVRSPMVAFVVDVQCPEASMAREYALLADNAPIERLVRRPDVPAPVAPSSLPASLPAGTPAGEEARPAGETLLLAGATTLNAMARALYPDDRAARDAYRAAFAAANPELLGGKVNIGSIPLPAGTRLKAPAGVPLPGSTAMPSAATKPGKAAPATSAGASPVPGARGAPVSPPAAKAEGRKGDRLTVGTANPQMQMLADAIMRLEATMGERDKINAELVGGVSSALNSIIELKDRVGAQDKQVQQLIALQLEAERLRAREREAQPGPWTLLALVLAAMAAGAGLIALHHTLAARRRAPAGRTYGEALAADADEQSPDPWAQAADQAVAEPADFADDMGATRVMGSRGAGHPASPPPPPPPVARVMQPRTPLRAGAAFAAVRADPPPDAREAFELGDLLDLFSQQKAAVTAMIQRLQATRSRDPEEWLTLLREARSAGLLNSEELQTVLAQFKQLFNAVVTHEECAAGIDGFPQVIRRIQGCWGRSECLKLINGLLYDDRDGGRQGFPEGAFADLVLLRDVLAVRIAMYGEEPEVAPPAPVPPSRAEHRAAAANGIDFQLELPPKD